MKSTKMIELRTTMPRRAMKPIIDVAVKNAPHCRMRRQDADEREGIAAMIKERRLKDWNQPTTEHVDQHRAPRRRREPEIRNTSMRDVPLASPISSRTFDVSKGLRRR
jgi:hypothetical protein